VTSVIVVHTTSVIVAPSGASQCAAKPRRPMNHSAGEQHPLQTCRCLRLLRKQPLGQSGRATWHLGNFSESRRSSQRAADEFCAVYTFKSLHGITHNACRASCCIKLPPPANRRGLIPALQCNQHALGQHPSPHGQGTAAPSAGMGSSCRAVHAIAAHCFRNHHQPGRTGVVDLPPAVQLVVCMRTAHRPRRSGLALLALACRACRAPPHMCAPTPPVPTVCSTATP
jgi:hypothetical protein